MIKNGKIILINMTYLYKNIKIINKNIFIAYNLFILGVKTSGVFLFLIIFIFVKQLYNKQMQFIESNI